MPVSCSSGTVTDFSPQVMVASRIWVACLGSAERWNTTERTKAQNSPDTRKITQGLSVRRRMAAAPTLAPDSVQDTAKNSRYRRRKNAPLPKATAAMARDRAHLAKKAFRKPRGGRAASTP